MKRKGSYRMKEVWNQKLAAAVLTAVLAGSTSVVWAAEQEQAEKPAQEIVITANRLKNQKVDTPADVTVITSQQISDRGYRTVTDALEDVPGARVLDASGPAFERRVILNGDDRVVVMVDGRRINYSMGSTNGKSTFDANTLPGVSMIERIEVVKGGASTLYGADAVGGVINIITKKSTGKPSVTVGATTGTTNMSNYYHIDLGKQGKFSSTFDMNFSKDRQWTEHEVSGLPVKNLQGPKQDYHFSGSYELGENKNLNLDLGYYKDKLSGDWSHKEYNLGAWGGIVRLQDAKLETERRDASLSLTGKTKKDDYMVRTFYSKLDKFRFLPYTALAKEYGETNKYSIWGIIRSTATTL